MRTPICEQLGIEYPIFAFTHCRDVVAEVSKAGGLGVLGAVGFSLERLREELDWVDAHSDGKPYAVDVVIPQKYEGAEETDPVQLEQQLKAMVPQQHRDFAEQLLCEHGVPEWPEKDEVRLMGWTGPTGRPMVQEALRHKQVVMVANALGTPPEDVIAEIHDSGRLVAALCGRVRQAQRHRDAGVDIIIAQGTEGGGHTGEVGSVVLWPQIVEAVAPTPVLAAGGVVTGNQMAAALAVGAAGVWTGSLWLCVQEAQAEPAEKESYFQASSEDTVRSRSWTGKPCRMLRNRWTEAWAQEDTPNPLGMPLQGLVTSDAMRRTKTYAAASGAQAVAFNPVGQAVGQISEAESCREVVFRLLGEYVDAVERLQELLPEV